MKKILSVLCVVAMIASFACVGASAADPVVTFELVAAPVVEGATTLTVDLVVTLPADATGYELGSFGLDMNYDNSVMELAAEPEWDVGGNCVNSENVTDLPYLFLWVTIATKDQLDAGSNKVATMTFNLKEAAVAGTEYKVELAANADNPTASMASKDGAYTETAYTAEQLSIKGASVVATVPTTEPPVTTTVTETEPVTTPEPEAEATTTKAPEAEVTTPEVTTPEVTTTAKAPAKAPQTGDMMFVVAVVMVAVLGAAVVVKKVNVK